MADTITTTVERDGEEFEVEVDPSQHGLVTKDELKSRLSEEIAKVRKAEREKAREGRFTLDDLAEDEDLQQKVRDRYPELFASENGDGEGEGDQGLTEEDLERVRQKIRSKEVDPLKEQLESVQSEAKRLRVEKLDREVVEAANELGVRKGLLPLVKRFYRDQMDYSEEDAEWYRTDGESFDISTDDEFDARYVTVLEDLKERKSSGEFADWFESSTREGAGFEGGPEGGGGGAPKKRKSEMTATEKREFVAEHGHQEFEKLPW